MTHEQEQQVYGKSADTFVDKALWAFRHGFIEDAVDALESTKAAMVKSHQAGRFAEIMAAVAPPNQRCEGCDATSSTHAAWCQREALDRAASQLETPNELYNSEFEESSHA